MEFDKAKMMEVVKKNIDLAGLVNDTIDEILEPVLQGFVADSSNPYDDLLLAAIYPVLERELKDKVEELLGGLFEAKAKEEDAPAEAEAQA